MNNINPRVKEYFEHDRAASVWWNVDNLPRYKKQTKWLGSLYDFRDKKVLDLACGKGRFSIAAALGGAEKVVAVDISKQMIKEARKKAATFGVQDQIEFHVSDVESFKSDYSFDLIILVEVLVHLPNPGKMLFRCHEMLCDGGVLVTNVDLPIMSKDFFQKVEAVLKNNYNNIPGSIRRICNKRFGWPLNVEKKVRYQTVEETLRKLEEDHSKPLSRPDDVYRPINEAELDDKLRSAGFRIIKSKKEYYMGLRVGTIVMAAK